jgi:4-azaleucine resistance transporter AzlC
MHNQLSNNSIPTKSIIKQGFITAWPLCLGYIPIGLAFGVLAQKAGLNPLQIGLMSLVVFAGSSQFIAISMLSSGAGLIPIITTTFMVNLRHLLMSSALSVHFRHTSKKFQALFAYGVTDESFAINLLKFKYGDWDTMRALAVNHIANFTWIIATVIGGYYGRFVPPEAFGIDYALIAMFIFLLIFQLRGKEYIITAVIAGALSVTLFLVLPGNLNIIVASIFAATLGVILAKIIGRSRINV